SFFFQAEDGIRDKLVTGVQTCALPISLAIILIWQAASVAGLVSPRVLPAPSDVARAGWKLLWSGELGRNIWVSFWRASIGFLIRSEERRVGKGCRCCCSLYPFSQFSLC